MFYGREEQLDQLKRLLHKQVGSLARPEGVSLRTALVYSGELSSYVETNGYFDAIVPITRLMGLS